MNKALQTALLLSVLLLTACLAHYSVIPHHPAYLLKAPDSSKTPYPDILRDYNGFDRARDSIDLRPTMEIQIENAYYEKGASRRGLKGYLGTETAQYAVSDQGLRLLSVRHMKDRPANDAPVQQLIPEQGLKFRYYRLYYELVFARNKDSHGSALLGADSVSQLNQLAAQSDSVCDGTSFHCTVFPEACSVSVEIKISVNGKTQNVGWGSMLSSLVPHPRHLAMKRLYKGRLVPIKINPADPDALRLPLLPGDEITWS
ncbi:MAG: hypothetical protein WA324_08990 [Bryobacteraceae bacterium]